MTEAEQDPARGIEDGEADTGEAVGGGAGAFGRSAPGVREFTRPFHTVAAAPDHRPYSRSRGTVSFQVRENTRRPPS